MATASAPIEMRQQSAKRARTNEPDIQQMQQTQQKHQQQVVAWERFNTLHFHDQEEDVVVPVSIILPDLDLPWFNGRLARVLQEEVKELMSQNLAAILFRAGDVDKSFTQSKTKAKTTNFCRGGTGNAQQTSTATVAEVCSSKIANTSSSSTSLTATKATMLTQVIRGKHIIVHVSVNPRVKASQAFLTKSNSTAAIVARGGQNAQGARFMSHRGSDVRIVAKVEPIEDGSNGYDDEDDEDD